MRGQMFLLLDHGIDVLTTMNIQHLESQNDRVYQIIGVRVCGNGATLLGSEFICEVPASAGQFTIPARIFQSISSTSLPFSSTAISASQPFSALGIDV